MKLEMQSRGIIIRKHFPQKIHLSIIDEQYGHLSVIPSSWQWASYASVGAIISYELVEEPYNFFVKQVELLMVPSYQNELVLLFMHHLVEICYFCLPVQSGKTECFDLLLYIIRSLDQFSSCAHVQKLLLAKLLFIIGQYPIDVEQLTVSSLLYRHHEELVRFALTHEQRKEIEIFIYQCIKAHPYGRLLKTVNFLSQVR